MSFNDSAPETEP